MLLLFVPFAAHADHGNNTESILVSKSIREEISHQLHTSEDSLSISPALMALSSNFSVLPFHQLLVQSPLQSIDTVKRLTTNISDPQQTISSLIHNLTILGNQRIGPVEIPAWDPQKPGEKDFVNSFSFLFQDHLSDYPSWKSEVQEVYQSVSPDLILFLHSFIQQVKKSYPWMTIGRESLATIADLQTIEAIGLKNTLHPFEIKILQALQTKGDRKSIFRAGAEISSVVDAFMQNRSFTQSYSLKKPCLIKTPLGDIMIAGRSNDTHEFQHSPLLFVDCGGDDTYKGPFAQSAAIQPISILIDLQGSDTYTYESGKLGAACGVMGMAGLFDLGEGADQYHGQERCFSYSFLGVSVLFDEKGDSFYDTHAYSLGASEMGISILYDQQGTDTYKAYHHTQGYGGFGGVALLQDRSGSDTYIAYATPVVHPSAQLNNRNHSAAQGFGSGRFGPAQDGISLHGGVGILIDRQGDDTYQASVFSQGSGYGFGIGILADMQGNDIHLADWYALGSAAHQGCGLFWDQAGNDVYRTSHYMMAGAGTDLSLAVFADQQGNDQYSALNASLGYSLSNSFSLFIDHDGLDVYDITHGQGAGKAGNDLHHTLRGLWPTTGVFLDLNGQDRYNHLSGCGNNSQWPDFRNDSNSKEYELGLDRDAAP